MGRQRSASGFQRASLSAQADAEESKKKKKLPVAGGVAVSPVFPSRHFCRRIFFFSLSFCVATATRRREAVECHQPNVFLALSFVLSHFITRTAPVHPDPLLPPSSPTPSLHIPPLPSLSPSCSLWSSHIQAVMSSSCGRKGANVRHQLSIHFLSDSDCAGTRVCVCVCVPERESASASA